MSTRFFTLDGIEVPDLAVARLSDDDATDGYTDEPTHLRIYDEGDDEYPWMLDGFDPITGRYTEDVRTFATEAEALSFAPAFVKFHGWSQGECPTCGTPRGWETYTGCQHEVS